VFVEENMKQRIAFVLVALALPLSIWTFPALAAPGAPEATAWTDDFDSPTLDPRWFWLNEDPTHWSLTARPGFMRVTAQEGWTNLLLQAVPAGDYVVETHLLFEPTQNIQRAGLFLLQNGDNNLFLMRAFCGYGGPGCPGNAIFLDIMEDGAPVESVVPMTTVSTNEAYLRVVKKAQAYTAYISGDGAQWTLMSTHVAGADFAPTAIGLMADYTGQGAGEIPADFDYFSLKPWTDGFDSPALNPSWEWINEEPEYWSLTDRPGFLRILQLSGMPEKNLLKQRDAPVGDYEVITRVQFDPSHTFQKAGIVISPGGIYDAYAVYLFRGGCYDSGPAFCHDDAIYFENWEPSGMSMQSLYPWSHTDTYLRLVKRGLTYTGYAGMDGATWTEVGSWTATWTGGKPGLAAHNPVDDPTGIIPADFDFFALNTLPVRVYLPLILR
jgi:hypothetical protein